MPLEVNLSDHIPYCLETSWSTNSGALESTGKIALYPLVVEGGETIVIFCSISKPSIFVFKLLQPESTRIFVFKLLQTGYTRIFTVYRDGVHPNIFPHRIGSPIDLKSAHLCALITLAGVCSPADSDTSYE